MAAPHHRAWALAAVSAAVLIGAGPAVAPVKAQRPEAGETDTAAEGGESEVRYRALVDAALVEYRRAHWTEALELFERAYEARPTARVLRGIALVLFEMRAYVRSVDAIDAALRSDVDPLTPRLRAQLLDVRARAEGFIGTVRIEVEPTDATVTVDGRALAPDARQSLRLEAGEHHLEATRDGYAPERRLVEVGAGTEVRVRLSLARVEPERIETVESPPAGPIIAWGAATAVVAGVTVAAAFWWRDRGDELGECRDATTRRATCTNEDTLSTQRNLAVAATLGGAAFTVATAWLFVASLNAAPERAPTVACGVEPRGGGCTARLRW